MKLTKKIENWFSAAAFAEAGEFETARRLAAEDVEADAGKDRTEDVKLGSPAIGRRRLASKA